MSLSWLAIMLGAAVAVPQACGWLYPEKFRRGLRAFPRSLAWGYVLVAVATVWFLYNLNAETIADFEKYKGHMVIGFAALGAMTCLFVQDFLAVRGLALVFLLLAKLMVDTARWADTPWRLVIVVWAYILVVSGMWLTIAPWRLRDVLSWVTQNDGRARMTCAAVAVFGILVMVLGVTVFE